MFIKICGITINTNMISYIKNVEVYPKRRFSGLGYGGTVKLTKQQEDDQMYTENRMRVHFEGEKHLDLDIPEAEFYKYFRRVNHERFFADLDVERDKDSAYRPPADVGSEPA